MGGRRARRLCPDAVVAAADGGLLGGEQGRVSRLRGHDAARRGALDRRGVPRHPRDGKARGQPGRDRQPAPRRPGARRPADHGRSGANEVPRQGRERRGEARRAPRRAPGPSSRSTPAPGRATVGRRSGHGRAAPPDRITTVAQVGFPETALATIVGRAAGRHLHALAHNRDPRPWSAPAAAVNRLPAGRTCEIGRGGRRRPRRARRPGDTADAGRRPRREGRSSCACASTTSRVRPAR